MCTYLYFIYIAINLFQANLDEDRNKLDIIRIGRCSVFVRIFTGESRSCMGVRSVRNSTWASCRGLIGWIGRVFSNRATSIGTGAAIGAWITWHFLGGRTSASRCSKSTKLKITFRFKKKYNYGFMRRGLDWTQVFSSMFYVFNSSHLWLFPLNAKRPSTCLMYFTTHQK